MYVKRKINVNDIYCIKSSTNKNANVETSSKSKLSIVDPTQYNNNYICSKTKDENHNYCIAKNKYKKGPLPMKSRAFPESFWQQPNKTSLISPGTVHFSDESALNKEEDTSANKPTDVEEISLNNTQEIITQPNIDLLFSLFRNVEEEEKKSLGRPTVLRNRRPKKLKTNVKVARDDDPYLTSSAADSFLPLLTERTKNKKDDQVSSVMSTKTPAINLLLTANSANQNFSKILSDLVVKL